MFRHACDFYFIALQGYEIEGLCFEWVTGYLSVSQRLSVVKCINQ